MRYVIILFGSVRNPVQFRRRAALPEGRGTLLPKLNTSPGRAATNLVGLGGLSSLPESVLKPARHVSQVPHSTGSRRLSPTGLDAPVVLSDLRGWVTARGAHLLLVVKRALSAPGTQRVRLVVALTWSVSQVQRQRDTKNEQERERCQRLEVSIGTRSGPSLSDALAALQRIRLFLSLDARRRVRLL